MKTMSCQVQSLVHLCTSYLTRLAEQRKRQSPSDGNGLKPFFCDVCDTNVWYVNPGDWVEHFRINHGSKSTPTTTSSRMTLSKKSTPSTNSDSFDLVKLEQDPIILKPSTESLIRCKVKQEPVDSMYFSNQTLLNRSPNSKSTSIVDKSTLNTEKSTPATNSDSSYLVKLEQDPIIFKPSTESLIRCEVKQEPVDSMGFNFSNQTLLNESPNSISIDTDSTDSSDQTNLKIDSTSSTNCSNYQIRLKRSPHESTLPTSSLDQSKRNPSQNATFETISSDEYNDSLSLTNPTSSTLSTTSSDQLIHALDSGVSMQTLSNQLLLNKLSEPKLETGPISTSTSNQLCQFECERCMEIVDEMDKNEHWCTEAVIDHHCNAGITTKLVQFLSQAAFDKHMEKYHSLGTCPIIDHHFNAGEINKLVSFLSKTAYDKSMKKNQLKLTSDSTNMSDQLNIDSMSTGNNSDQPNLSNHPNITLSTSSFDQLKHRPNSTASGQTPSNKDGQMLQNKKLLKPKLKSCRNSSADMFQCQKCTKFVNVINKNDHDCIIDHVCYAENKKVKHVSFLNQEAYERHLEEHHSAEMALCFSQSEEDDSDSKLIASKRPTTKKMCETYMYNCKSEVPDGDNTRTKNQTNMSKQHDRSNEEHVIQIPRSKTSVSEHSNDIGFSHSSLSSTSMKLKLNSDSANLSDQLEIKVESTPSADHSNLPKSTLSTNCPNYQIRLKRNPHESTLPTSSLDQYKRNQSQNATLETMSSDQYIDSLPSTNTNASTSSSSHSSNSDVAMQSPTDHIRHRLHNVTSEPKLENGPILTSTNNSSDLFKCKKCMNYVDAIHKTTHRCTEAVTYHQCNARPTTKVVSFSSQAAYDKHMEKNHSVEKNLCFSQNGGDNSGSKNGPITSIDHHFNAGEINKLVSFLNKTAHDKSMKKNQSVEMKVQKEGDNSGSDSGVIVASKPPTAREMCETHSIKSEEPDNTTPKNQANMLQYHPIVGEKHVTPRCKNNTSEHHRNIGTSHSSNSISSISTNNSLDQLTLASDSTNMSDQLNIDSTPSANNSDQPNLYNHPNTTLSTSSSDQLKHRPGSTLSEHILSSSNKFRQRLQNKKLLKPKLKSCTNRGRNISPSDQIGCQKCMKLVDIVNEDDHECIQAVIDHVCKAGIMVKKMSFLSQAAYDRHMQIYIHPTEKVQAIKTNLYSSQNDGNDSGPNSKHIMASKHPVTKDRDIGEKQTGNTKPKTKKKYKNKRRIDSTNVLDQLNIDSTPSANNSDQPNLYNHPNTTLSTSSSDQLKHRPGSTLSEHILSSSNKFRQRLQNKKLLKPKLKSCRNRGRNISTSDQIGCQKCMKLVDIVNEDDHECIQAVIDHVCNAGVMVKQMSFLSQAAYDRHMQLIHPTEKVQAIKTNLYSSQNDGNDSGPNSKLMASKHPVTKDSDIGEKQTGNTKPKTKKKYKYKRRIELPIASPCPTCGKVMKSREALRRHKNIHKEKRYKCSYCSKIFHTRMEQRVHDRAHTGETPYECKICGDKFKYLASFKLHSRKHTGVTFDCYICDKKCLSLSTLKAHNQTHTGETPFQCNTCGKMFRTKQGYSLHMKNSHTDHDNRTVCDICGKSYTNLRQHQIVHTDARPYVCGICGRSFRSYLGRRHHQNSHSNKKDFVCFNCGKGFNRKDRWLNHAGKCSGNVPSRKSVSRYTKK